MKKEINKKIKPPSKLVVTTTSRQFSVYGFSLAGVFI